MADYEHILYEARGAVALITLNRPEKLNAWTPTMEDEFIAAVRRAATDAAIGCVVVTGAGRGFCAGADISGWDRELQGAAPRRRSNMLSEAGSPEVPIALSQGKPVVAAINGVAVGIGLTMTLACDIRIASTEARFSARFVKVGLTPECGSTRYLPLVAGLPNALFMTLTGRIIDAQEALRRGLVEALVAPGELLPAALKLAEEIAANPHEAVWAAKRMLHMNAMEQDLRRVVALESYSIRERQTEPDHREAVRAFMEKREPRFNQDG
ncbi:MAG: enoyl-CoA hydratase/isomerase family protein [Chloroflexota bacterium]|nr:enoyl-CoA hydratase/isomerase family protein [Chloroflexota bacterium]